MMTVRDQVMAYLKNEPFALCEPTLAADLEQVGWKLIAKNSRITTSNYGIANCISDSIPTKSNIFDLVGKRVKNILIEVPDFQILQNFYEEHGLEPLTEAELQTTQVLKKLQEALTLLEKIEPVYSCINHFVKTIQILRQDDAEIDISYSHPKIPFSVFLSVCEDASLLSSLRVAESILHEAMHLQLTLIENVIDLVHPNSQNYYFSPWRHENRPARGILHGIFVFRAVHDFYITFTSGPNLSYSKEVKDFILCRIESIEKEFSSLSYFSQIPDLTPEGKILTINLLEYYVSSKNQKIVVNN